MNLTKNYKEVKSGVYLGKDGLEFRMEDVQKNGLTAAENIIRGFKGDTNRKLNIVSKAEEKGIDVKGLIEEYLTLKDNFDNDFSKFGILAKSIKKTTEASFKRYGDANYLNRTLKRNYISKEGTPIDVMIEELNEIYYSNLETDDVIDFITSFENGSYEYDLYAKITEFEGIFKEMVGFNIDRTFAKMFNDKVRYESGDFAVQDEVFGMINIPAPF